LSEPARLFIDTAASDGRSIALSTISLAEIVYLVEKGRLDESAYQELRGALLTPDFVFEEVPDWLTSRLARPSREQLLRRPHVGSGLGPWVCSHIGSSARKARRGSPS
jgi:hypothetical protein